MSTAEIILLIVLSLGIIGCGVWCYFSCKRLIIAYKKYKEYKKKKQSK